MLDRGSTEEGNLGGINRETTRDPETRNLRKIRTGRLGPEGPEGERREGHTVR